MKNNVNKKMLFVTTIICMLPVILGSILYSRIPEDMAIHFDVYGKPNNYAPKAVFVFGVPLAMACLQAVLCYVMYKKGQNTAANRKINNVSLGIIPVITNVLYVVTCMYALDIAVDIRVVAMVIVGITLVVIGNYLPKTKGDVYINIPFAMEDKYKRQMGIASILFGGACLLSVFFHPFASVFVIAALLVYNVAFCIYALVLAKKKK